MSEYAIHVGLHAAKGTAQELEIKIRNALQKGDDPFTVVEAYVDGDSYREWGENIANIDYDDYYHVVVYYTAASNSSAHAEGRSIFRTLQRAGLVSMSANCASLDAPEKHFNFCVSRKEDWNDQIDWGYLN